MLFQGRMMKEWTCGEVKTWKCPSEFGCVVEVLKPSRVAELDISLGLSIRTHSLVRANQNLPFKKVYVVSKRNVRLFFFKFQVTKILTELTLLA
jgi:hypothetical protein